MTKEQRLNQLAEELKRLSLQGTQELISSAWGIWMPHEFASRYGLLEFYPDLREPSGQFYWDAWDELLRELESRGVSLYYHEGDGSLMLEAAPPEEVLDYLVSKPSWHRKFVDVFKHWEPKDFEDFLNPAGLKLFWHTFMLKKSAALAMAAPEIAESYWNQGDAELINELTNEDLIKAFLKLLDDLCLPHNFHALCSQACLFCITAPDCDHCPYGQKKGQCNEKDSIWGKAQSVALNLFERESKVKRVPVFSQAWYQELVWNLLVQLRPNILVKEVKDE